MSFFLHRLSHIFLCRFSYNAENDLIDANLGGGVIKQRVARDGEGKSGGFRTLILFKLGNRAFLFMDLRKMKKIISMRLLQN
jgi:hypothetical protein